MKPEQIAKLTSCKKYKSFERWQFHSYHGTIFLCNPAEGHIKIMAPSFGTTALEDLIPAVIRRGHFILFRNSSQYDFKEAHQEFKEGHTTLTIF